MNSIKYLGNMPYPNRKNNNSPEGFFEEKKIPEKGYYNYLEKISPQRIKHEGKNPVP